jgi:RNA polymerase sigma factor (TIGR02999 family)
LISATVDVYSNGVHVAMSDFPPEIGELLAKWESGDKEALRLLFPLIYKDLRRLAHYRMRKQRPNHTLQPTALVHEAYMRLENRRPAHFQNPNHFVAVCALLMRQILVQYERARLAEKRGGGAERVTLDDALGLANDRRLDLIALDDKLNGLARLDPQQGMIVELRFFGGLSIEETAAELGISPATVKRHWETARLWLYRQMRSPVHDSRRKKP